MHRVGGAEVRREGLHEAEQRRRLVRSVEPQRARGVPVSVRRPQEAETAVPLPEARHRLPGRLGLRNSNQVQPKNIDKSSLNEIESFYKRLLHIRMFTKTVVYS